MSTENLGKITTKIQKRRLNPQKFQKNWNKLKKYIKFHHHSFNFKMKFGINMK